MNSITKGDGVNGTSVFHPPERQHPEVLFRGRGALGVKFPTTKKIARKKMRKRPQDGFDGDGGFTGVEG
jgi:hypothetical protein